MTKHTFLIWLITSPFIAGAIAWILQTAGSGPARCAVADPCEIMPSNEGSEL
jgi:hypothetical protein